jgi:hypothetical protein
VVAITGLAVPRQRRAPDVLDLRHGVLVVEAIERVAREPEGVTGRESPDAALALALVGVAPELLERLLRLVTFDLGLRGRGLVRTTRCSPNSRIDRPSSAAAFSPVRT